MLHRFISQESMGVVSVHWKLQLCVRVSLTYRQHPYSSRDPGIRNFSIPNCNS